MAQPQSSRLHRLLTLLDTGSTLTTRRTAARQIGEIAKSRPEELHALLKKVSPFLRSKNWDTRVAAALAVGAIAENVNQLSLKDLLANAQAQLMDLGHNVDLNEYLMGNWITQCTPTKALTFQSFDIQRVMDYGAPLLSSGGQEYDVGVDDKTFAERLARQKQNLRRRLGLDVCEQFMDVNDMIRDDDLMQRGSSSENGQWLYGSFSQNAEVKQGVQQLVADMVPGNVSRNLSARERNLLKRKAKGTIKDAPKGWCEDDELDEPSSKRAKSMKSAVVDQSQSGDKILMEAVPDDDDVGMISDGQWPFGHFVEQLVHDMFDRVWEVRHGSIMALREILSSQAACAAVAIADLEGNSDCDGDRKEQVASPKREREIDLNIGLGLEDTSDLKRVKLVKSCGHGSHGDSGFGDADIKTITLEQEWLNSAAISVKAGCSLGSVKHELDLNEEIKAGQSLEGGIGTLGNENCKEKVDILSNLKEDSRSIKILKDIQQAWASNTEFLQDSAIRFLCIFSLDRFGDYVSDQVVAPVRETCAQALGAVLKHMHPSLVHETLSILLHMQGRPEWEVRHGSLLGIKYLVAVRQEMLPELLPRVLPACIAGLEDRDDDVRAVAAEAMTPAAAAIVSSGENAVNTILLMLWDILLDLDDLSPSTSSVMRLLAELYSQHEVVPRTLGNKTAKRPMFDLNEAILDDESENEPKQTDDPFLLSTLAPRLWPFMRHSISSVRHAAISTLERLLEAGNQEISSNPILEYFWVVPILGDALRLVYQNLLLEADEAIVECSKRVWKLLLQSPKDDLALAAEIFFPSWLKLASTAAGAPLETSKMFSPTTLPRKSHFRAAAKLRAAKSGSSTTGDATWHRQKDDDLKDKKVDSSFSTTVPKVVVGAECEKSVVQLRSCAASALGIIAASLPNSMYDMIVKVLTEHLASTSGVQRQVASMVLVSWFRELRKSPEKSNFIKAIEDTKALRLQLLELLGCGDPALPTPACQSPYAELTRTYAKMRGEAASLIKHAESAGLCSKMVSVGLPALEEMSAEVAIDVAMKTVTLEAPSTHGPADDKQNPGLELVESLRQRLLATAGYLKLVQNNLHVSVLASMAGAVVWMGELPAKLNPVIQPLMAAIKREQEEILQQLAADALAETIAQCVGRKPSPNEKLTKNLCTLTCADPAETPQATQANALTINLDDIEISSCLRTGGFKPRTHAISSGEERSRIEGVITRRGAEFALKSLCSKFGGSLFEKLSKLWDCLTEALCLPVTNGTLGTQSWRGMGTIEQTADPQALINNLQVIRSITPVLDKGLESKLMLLLPSIFGCVRHSHAAVRLAAARCITAMAKAWRETLMIAVLEKCIPMLDDASSVEARQGGGMLLMFLVEGLGTDLVPYAPLLIVPLLGCMSDSDSTVRQSVTHSFAALVPLLPLARGVAPPAELNDCLSSRRAEDTRFLEQLLDNSQVDDYTLCIELKTPLRRYQQEGINWLAFLKRFKLHGILCDDMGLGKTLQASAIVASDTAERLAAQGADTQKKVLPSLIVCPSTLVGHWVFEIDKFLQTSVLKPLQYVGSPQDRLQLQAQFDEHNLVVTSYDVLRKDVEFFGTIVWNFCILDEGHIIKNSKSKVTLAVKQIKAEHRLILSGTPIQNNVLELWSLFDFLMPGFLGSERQFQSAYGKPILAARDAKCSAKEAEAGALAMEALHKQVMPFLLRRTKDEVLLDLPPKIIQDRYCDLSPLQVRLYERFSHSQAKVEVSSLVQEYNTSTENAESSSRTSTHVFQALQYLRKLCSHPLLVLDDMQQDYVASLQSEFSPTSKDTKPSFHDLHHSPKLLALKEILEECGIGLQSGSADSPALGEGGQHRVLIFAQLKSFLDIIEKDLFQSHMKGVTYLRLDGSIEPDKRFDIVKAFNSDPTIDVLLLTTHVGGLGLNLTAADTVVFMEHDWNPMRDLQAMDRAHRLGQKRVVNVHRLVMRGTLEEKVMSLQRFKLSVANTVINAENASLNSMDTTQLLDLFTVSGGGKVVDRVRHNEDEQDLSVTTAAAGSGKGLKAMLNGLEELWDQSQYNEEYNLNQFVARLN